MINLGTQPCDQLKSLLCAQDLRDRGDGTVSSAYQNLLWQKCEGGQAWNGACMGAVTTMPFCTSANNTCNGGSPTGTLSGTGNSQIYAYCNTLHLGERTWRVPTVAELQELYRSTRIDSSLFPGLTATYYYSNLSASTTHANAVLFSDGTAGMFLKATPLRIRCVSDGM